MKVGFVVMYKAQVALVLEISDGKILIECDDGEKKRVREKDVFVLSEGPVSKLSDVLNAELPPVDFSESFEFFSQSTSFEEIVSLFYVALEPKQIWKAWLAVSESPYFKVKVFGAPITVLSKSDVELLKQKELEKQNEDVIYQEFLNEVRTKLTQVSKASTKKSKLLEAEPLIDTSKYSRFIQELEQVALGKKPKSHILFDLKRKQQAETAHDILLALQVWPLTKNPYPSRVGVSAFELKEPVECPSYDKPFTDLSHLTSFAIDNEGSSDPDDAVCLDGDVLYIHVACPAEVIHQNSKIDEEACERGASLYLPETVVRMLPEKTSDYFALGLTEQCYALTFSIRFDENFTPRAVDIFRSKISVTRMTYEEADRHKDGILKGLFDLANKLFDRRIKNGAISIEMPEVQIRVENKTEILLSQAKQAQSTKVVREMMLIAGEAGALFAFKNNIPFQYISQEQASIPTKLPEGLAGEYHKRKHMRSRAIGTVPSKHFGLGLSMYAQVTSPLRRYCDLISHQQILRFIDGEPLIDKDTLLQKLSRSELAVRKVNQASRLSRLHIILVYLMANPEKTYEAVVLDLIGNKAHIVILELAFEIDINLKTEKKLNDTIFVKVQSVNLSFQQCVCVEV